LLIFILVPLHTLITIPIHSLQDRRHQQNKILGKLKRS